MEVVISIALFAIVLLVLNHSVDRLRTSNTQLIGYLHKSNEENRIFNTLYRDIAGSDGNLTMVKNDFTRLCVEETCNTLYGLPSAKVCWLVLKENNTLVRVEGNDYLLPTTNDHRVQIDKLLQNIELFDIYHSGDKVLVVTKIKGKDPVTFMVQGLNGPKVKGEKVPPAPTHQ